MRITPVTLMLKEDECEPLNQRYYTRKDYEALFEIISSYAVKFLRKKEKNKLLRTLCVANVFNISKNLKFLSRFYTNEDQKDLEQAAKWLTKGELSHMFWAKNN